MITAVTQIESRMYLIRGQQVMLSQHLAELYEVEPRVLNKAVKRNIERFPEDFMFQPDATAWGALRSQFVTLNVKSQIVISNEKPAGHRGGNLGLSPIIPSGVV